MIAALAGCAPTPVRAPVSERTAQEPKKPPVKAAVQVGPDSRPKTYTVKKGDTLYSIALDHGIDYKELAQWNGLDDPARLRVGQQLRVTSPQEPAITPVQGPAGVETRALGAFEPPRAEPLRPESAKAGTYPPAPVKREVLRPLEPTQVEPAIPGSIKTEPKALKLPYSEQNLALVQRASPAAPTVAPQAPSEIPEPTKPEAAAKSGPPMAKAEPATPLPAKPELKPDEPADEDSPDWIWPTQGKVIAGFTEASKGVDIGGRAGQAVVASAAGKVVYSGSGLRGYGKLIIIKHNKTYLSAYAHNDQLLVKEGQSVSRGQKIAEMGSSDADRVKLHFEIRRFGKPVDPLKYLPDLS